MKQIILLTSNTNYVSAKTNRMMMIIGGVVYVGLGIFQFYRYQNEYLVFLILTSISGIYFIFFGYFGLSEKSKYAPKVFLNEDFIQIKKSFWKPANKIVWSEVLSINYRSYQIDFRLNKGVYSFNYNTTSETSIEIKRAIRSFAEIKGIEVNGG